MSEDARTRAQRLVSQMTLEEKSGLTAGGGMFSLAGVERLGIPSWPVTDGPNGARGSSLLGTGDAVALCVPSGAALGASWDPTLVEEVGRALGAEARTKRAGFLLAPTVNIHRDPRAGRNFECYSEDPILSGRTAAGFVRGVQSEGVGVTVKHLVGNEAETERYTTDSVIDQRTLREVYLRPFELAVREGGALGIMSSYNRVNGEYPNATPALLNGILRQEWGFDGIIMTDWYAALETVSGSAAGVDIEMPAGGPSFGPHLARAVEDGRVPESTVDEMATRIVGVMAELGLLDRIPGEEHNDLRPDHAQLAIRASAAATVLLRNEAIDGQPVLPLDGANLKRVALIGPNAIRPQLMGGGSAALRPQYRRPPVDAFREALGPSVEVTLDAGCSIDRGATTMTTPMVAGPDGADLPILEVFDATIDWSVDDGLATVTAGRVVHTSSLDQTKMVFGDGPAGSGQDGYSAVLRGTLLAPATGSYTFALSQVDTARFSLDGQTVCDGTRPQARGESFFGSGSVPVNGEVELEAGRRYSFELAMSATPGLMGAAEVGVRLPQADDPIGEAAAAAAEADVAVVVVGTNDDWETEGRDRTTIDLPGDQDLLITRVAEANPRTVVVLNTGGPVHVPWRDEVPAILQSWFGGQGMSEGLADVLTGRREPGGRLPTTFPLREEHGPSFGNFPGSNGVVRYGEGLLVGHRWYQARNLPMAFPFGHGLSYSTFELGSLSLSSDQLPVAGSPDGPASSTGAVTVSVDVTNTGDRPGSQVVQCYVAGPANDNPAAPLRPPLTLQGFVKVALEPGETTTATIDLPDRAFARWHDPDPTWSTTVVARKASLRMFELPELDLTPGWVVDAGTYEVVVATSSVDVVARLPIEVSTGFRLAKTP